MLFLILADNFLILFIGWEGVGLASYFLVNFWFTRIAANHASLKAFLMNRIGDWGLSIGIIMLLIVNNDINNTILLDNIHPTLLLILLLFFFIGISAKSAQLGLHPWLTSAMEGPTPVSALLHAATMVTAGIYIIMRLSYILEWSSDIFIILGWFGSLSAILGALGGLLEYDIKKIIAYSTISQLGYMVIGSYLHLYNLSLWHLVNHAFFKALLFLSAGAIIHAFFDNQDLRKYGSIILFIPLLYNVLLIGNLSLIAFPFLTGFYSKDLIIELTLSQEKTLIFIIISITAIITSLYTIRFFIFTFYNKPNFNFNIFLDSSIPFAFFLPLFILSLGSIYFGYITQNILYTQFIHLFIHPNFNHILDNLVFHNLFSLLPLFTFFLFLLPLINIQWKGTINILDSFNIYYHWFILKFFTFSNIFLRFFDRGFIELLTPYG